MEVGEALRAKIGADDAHKRFVDAVLQACRSPQAAKLGVERYTIEERGARDSRWTPITLTVRFSDRDIDSKLDAWSEMRHIVDGYIVPLRDGEGGRRRDARHRRPVLHKHGEQACLIPPKTSGLP